MGEIRETISLGSKSTEIDPEQRRSLEEDTAYLKTGPSAIIISEDAGLLGTDICKTRECPELLENCWRSSIGISTEYWNKL